MNILFFTTVKFYKLDLRANEVNKDILLNILTYLVLKKETGHVIRGLIRMKNKKKIKEFALVLDQLKDLILADFKV